MAITKPEFWLVSLGFILIMSIGLLLFGQSLQSSSVITLDNDSNTYLSQYTQRLNQSGFLSKADEAPKEPQNPVLRFITGIRGVTEIFGVVTLFSNIFTDFWNFLQLVFELPSFFLETLGLPMGGSTRFIVNILSTILLLGLTIMLARLVK